MSLFSELFFFFVAAVERAAQQQSYQSFQPQSQENNSQHWSQLSNTSQSPSTPAVYENWDVRRRAVEGISAASVGPRQTESSVTELSANLGATNAGTSLATAHQKSPRIGYNHGLHSTARATNADSQFQSVQHAVSPPTSTHPHPHPPTTQHYCVCMYLCLSALS